MLHFTKSSLISSGSSLINRVFVQFSFQPTSLESTTRVCLVIKGTAPHSVAASNKNSPPLMSLVNTISFQVNYEELSKICLWYGDVMESKFKKGKTKI